MKSKGGRRGRAASSIGRGSLVLANSQSIPARIMKDICPAGRENMIRDQAFDCCSRVTTSRNFNCTDRDSRWRLQCSACPLVRLLFRDLIRAMACVGEGAEGGLQDMVSRLLGGIDSLLANSGSNIRSSISMMFLSWDRRTWARSLSLAFSWTWGR